jgi:hypothetical protein
MGSGSREQVGDQHRSAPPPCAAAYNKPPCCFPVARASLLGSGHHRDRLERPTDVVASALFTTRWVWRHRTRLIRGSVRPKLSLALVTGVAAAWAQLDPAHYPFLRRAGRPLGAHDDRDQCLAGVELILAEILAR